MRQIRTRDKETEDLINKIEKQHRRIDEVDCYRICDIFMWLYETDQPKLPKDHTILDELTFMYNWILKSQVMELETEKVYGEKKCPRCHVIKELDMFGVSKVIKDGRTSYCKECLNRIQNQRTGRNKSEEWYAERQRMYYEKRIQSGYYKNRKKEKLSDEELKERKKETVSKYYQKNKERIKLQRKIKRDQSKKSKNEEV